MHTWFNLAALAAGLVLGGCGDPVKSPRGLRLPRGDAENGRAAFVALGCPRCHTIVGVDLPKPTEKPELVVALGGEVTRLRTVGDLMTSIIHPTDRLSEKWQPPPGPRPVKSPMPVVNDVMTVEQMIDLVTFLQPHYREVPPLADWPMDE